MRLRDDIIKRAIADYMHGDKDGALAVFRKETDLYIYNFPRMAYRKTLDFCSDFYLYVTERLDGILRNYPLDANIQFKTWFNYVLRNQMISFIRYTCPGEPTELAVENIDDYPSPDIISTDQADYTELRQGLAKLPPNDRVVIKFYYLPEMIDADDIREACKLFGITISAALSIQRSLIEANYADIRRIRDVSSKTAELNAKLSALKHRLYTVKTLDLGEKNSLLEKIARLEVARNKEIRRLELPDRKVFQEFTVLFKNIRLAQYRLSNAKKRLRFEVLKILRSKDEGA
jgi:RNA polymerase sigma factor (sigma-70 family)